MQNTRFTFDVPLNKIKINETVQIWLIFSLFTTKAAQK